MKIFSRLYIVLCLLTGLWCIGIVLAPLLSHHGYESIAKEQYSFYGQICHQNDMRSFHLLGEKLGVCIRCSAIYFGFLAALLIGPLFGLLRRERTPSLAFFLLIVVPMVLDVVLHELGLYVNSPLSRFITGSLFGFAIPWWVIPTLRDAIQQIQRQINFQSFDSGVNSYARKTS